MPVLPSEVGGTEPGGLSIDGGTGKRLRELCEVLLTARAKMLGLSRQMGSEMSGIPDRLRSSLVSSLAEIVTHLDSFEIQLGDTRLTGKAKLGADAGMASHFPSESRWASEERAPHDRRLHGPAGHRPLSGGHPQLSGFRAQPAASLPEPQRISLPAPREEELAPRRRRKRRSEEEAEQVARRKDGLDDGPGEELFRIAQARYRKGLARHPFDRLEHAMLVWVCLALLQEEPPSRPEGSYEQREQALESLARMGYARRAGKGWRPTPAGFEACGLVGLDGHLEIDP